VIAGDLVPPAIARGVLSTVPSASAPGIGPPAPLAGGPLGAIIGGHPLPREGVAEWVDPPCNEVMPRQGAVRIVGLQGVGRDNRRHGGRKN